MNRRSIALLASTAIAFALAGYATPRASAAQAVPQLFFVDSVRTRLAADWNDNDPTQHERAYCLTWQITPAGTRFQGILVTGITRAAERQSNQEQVAYSCPRSDLTAALHTHGPNTCDVTPFGLTCQNGGIEANLCSPSGIDVFSLERNNQPFGVIQCARDALVPFWRARAHVYADSVFRARWAKRSP